jgi:hypothetical protein
MSPISFDFRVNESPTEATITVCASRPRLNFFAGTTKEKTESWAALLLTLGLPIYILSDLPSMIITVIGQ